MQSKAFGEETKKRKDQKEREKKDLYPSKGQEG